MCEMPAPVTAPDPRERGATWAKRFCVLKGTDCNLDSSEEKFLQLFNFTFLPLTPSL